ncbi:hypothetical protein V2J09_007788 [Rumex salicifolius]
MVLRSLSFLRSPMRSSTVAPLTAQASFKGLKLSQKERIHVTAAELLDGMAELVTSLKTVSNAVSDPNNSGKHYRVRIEEYLENGVGLLEVCNLLLEKIESVKRYGQSVKRAARLTRPGMGPAGITRVKELLDTKKYYLSVEKCLQRRRREEEEDSLTRSLAETAEKCRGLDKALSFKKGRRSCGGGCTGQMVELRDLIELAKRLRDPTADVDGKDVAKKCDAIADAVGPLEEKVKEVYKELVCIRISLLGILSYN